MKGKMVAFVLSLSALLMMAPQVSPRAFQPGPQPGLKATGQGTAETPLAALVQQSKSAGRAFPVVNLFQPEASHVLGSGASQSSNAAAAQNAVEAGFILRLDPGMARALLDARLENLTLALPDDKAGSVELEMVKVNIHAADFSVVTSSSKGVPVNYEPGAHYRGVVKGRPGSLAAVSVFADEIMGLFSTPEAGNFVLGRLGGNNPGNDHILYAQDNLKKKQTFSCGTSDEGEVMPPSDLEEPQPDAVRCVWIFVEADYDIYLNKGSVSGVTNYVTGFFNQSAALFANEGIPISISQLYVWDDPSPYTQYTGNNSATLLSLFRTFRSAFYGEFGHLVALRGDTGGIAAQINAFCGGFYNRRAYSGIFGFYENVPLYSWTVDVFTHELGHLMGSHHTHACAWNGNNTPIDGCAPPEGSCPQPGIPSDGGTIMSYCHLQGVGKNFSKGFGPQPGNVIRNRYNGAGCVTHCF